MGNRSWSMWKQGQRAWSLPPPSRTSYILYGSPTDQTAKHNMPRGGHQGGAMPVSQPGKPSRHRPSGSRHCSCALWGSQLQSQRGSEAACAFAEGSPAPRASVASGGHFWGRLQPHPGVLASLSSFPLLGNCGSSARLIACLSWCPGVSLSASSA